MSVVSAIMASAMMAGMQLQVEATSLAALVLLQSQPLFAFLGLGAASMAVQVAVLVALAVAALTLVFLGGFGIYKGLSKIFSKPKPVISAPIPATPQDTTNTMGLSNTAAPGTTVTPALYMSQTTETQYDAIKQAVRERDVAIIQRDAANQLDKNGWLPQIQQLQEHAQMVKEKAEEVASRVASFKKTLISFVSMTQAQGQTGRAAEILKDIAKIETENNRLHAVASHYHASIQVNVPEVMRLYKEANQHHEASELIEQQIQALPEVGDTDSQEGQKLKAQKADHITKRNKADEGYRALCAEVVNYGNKIKVFSLTQIADEPGFEAPQKASTVKFK